LQASPAHAQLGKLLKEGVEAAGKKAFSGGTKKATHEGTEQLLKKVTTTTVRKAGQEAAESAAKQAGKQAAGAAIRNSDLAVKAISKHGAAIATPILSRYGDDGAKAIAKLSSTNARRMAMLTDELGAAGRGKDFMRVLAERGDVAADWIWKNKATIAVGTTAAAFLTNPDAFLQAAEGVVSSSVETAGKHVVEPIIEESAKVVTPGARN
jgi:hypothetical protein